MLTDHPRAFGTILALMGPYLQIMGTQIYVRHPEQEALMAFHTDAGPSLQRIHPHPESLPLQFKVQFFLTDLSAQDQGNFMWRAGKPQTPVPRERVRERCLSQWRDASPRRGRRCSHFPLGVMARCRPKSDRERIRKSVTFRYGQMWCRPYDYDTLPPDVLARMTPRRRRLFGELGENPHPTDYYKPQDQLEVIYGDEWASRNF